MVIFFNQKQRCKFSAPAVYLYFMVLINIFAIYKNFTRSFLIFRNWYDWVLWFDKTVAL